MMGMIGKRGGGYFLRLSFRSIDTIVAIDEIVILEQTASAWCSPPWGGVAGRVMLGIGRVW